MKKLAPVYNDPNLKLTDEEVDQLVAYLMTLKPDPDEAVVVIEVDPVERGREVFLNSGCSGCHNTSAETKIGPGLAGLGDRSSTDMIRESITDPSAVITAGFDDGVMFDTFGSTIPSGDLDALIQYLQTLE